MTTTTQPQEGTAVLTGKLMKISEAEKGGVQVTVYSVQETGQRWPREVVYWPPREGEQAPAQLTIGQTYAFVCKTKPTGKGGLYYNFASVDVVPGVTVASRTATPATATPAPLKAKETPMERAPSESAPWSARKFSISYRRTMNLGNYNSESIELMQEFDDSDNRLLAFDMVREQVRAMAATAAEERENPKGPSRPAAGSASDALVDPAASPAAAPPMFKNRGDVLNYGLSLGLKGQNALVALRIVNIDEIDVMGFEEAAARLRAAAAAKAS